MDLYWLVKSTSMYFFVMVNVHVAFLDSTFYCNLENADPCTSASSMYEPYARSNNCPYNELATTCDRDITPGWYSSDDLILDQCPVLKSCGASYPVWMNGTFPHVSDGVATNTLCTTGSEGCCVKKYDLKIKNCGSFYVYCLPALDTCLERVCFGTNGSCKYPSTTTTIGLADSSAHKTTSTTQQLQTNKNPITFLRSLLQKDLESPSVIAILVIGILIIALFAVVFNYFMIKKFCPYICCKADEIITS